MVKNRSLVTQFRITFALIVAASIIASAITYFLAAQYFIQAQNKSIYPANYYEEQIPGIDAYIRKTNLPLLSPSGEAGLRDVISGNGMLYQVVDGQGDVLYGTSQEKLFDTREALFDRLNTTFKQGDNYIHAVPIIDEDGKIAGAVGLSYQLKLSYGNSGGHLVMAVVVIALLSPFFYIIAFTFLFSKIFVKKINKPLQLLTNAAQNIKEKNLDFKIDYHAGNELGKLCDAFSEMKDELEKSLSAQWRMEQERVEMVEALAHDLKSPLSVIRGYTEALLDSQTCKDEKQCRYLSVIKENAEKSSALVQKMQYTSDLETQDVQLQLVPIDLPKLLEEKIQHFRLLAQQKGIDIALKLEGNPPQQLVTDADKMGRILDNVLSNSLQYTPDGGKISVFVKVEQERICYKICDSGSGFSHQDLQKAFDKFYRGDEARQTRAGHSGLGLYITKKLIKQLGGSISISNDTASGGACVTFWHKVALEKK